MTSSKRSETVEEYAAQDLARPIVRAAGELRHVAAVVERSVDTIARVGGPGRQTYASIAEDVQSEVLNMLVNLSLGSMIMAASDADRARQRRIAAEAIAAQIDAKAEAVREGADSPATGFALGAVVAQGAIIAREYAAKEG